MHVDLHIDRIVLDGVELDARHLPGLRAALTAELTRLLATTPADQWSASATTRTLRAPEITLAAVPSPTKVGRALARSVHRGIAGDAGRDSAQSEGRRST